ncbi:MAG: lamin tail domain-containing protein [Verrucomicrobia bacterium]|nr:lamin tail domain-containing protein [Verrucomicrobiota bacterium]
MRASSGCWATTPGTRNPAFDVLLDADNLIDYMLIIYYGGNLDAPISNFLGNTRPNNWFGVRNRTGNFGGFRFFVHDAEHTLLDLNQNRTGPFAAGNDSVVYSSPQWVFQRMWLNAEFRLRVADRIHKHFFNRGVLTPETATAMFLKRKNEIDRAVVGESARWGDAKRGTPFTRNAEWISAINNILNNYLPQRSRVVLDQLKARNLYPSIVAPTFSPSGGNVARGTQLTISAPAGTIFYTLDGRDPHRRGGGAILGARIYGGPITLNESAVVKARVLSSGNWSALNEAPFVIIQDYKELLITELMYNPPAATNLDGTIVDGDEFEFIELKNVASVELDLSGVSFLSGIDFTFPLGTKLGPGQFVVLVSNPAAFANKYPGVTVFGTYQGRLANGGETVTLVHAAGAPIFSVSYSDQAPWPLSPDGAGFSLAPINANANADPNNAANWRGSAQLGGSPGADDPPSNIPIVRVNEILTHTDFPALDTVELYNPNPFPVDLGYWYLTDDRTVPKKYRIPAGTKIQSNSFLKFDESHFNPKPGVEPSFTFSSHGEEVYLYSANAEGALTGFSDGFSFGAAANSVTFGRYVNSVGEVLYPAQTQNTLGAPNAGPANGPVVINEIRYHPALGDDEFIELHNVTDAAVKLYGPASETTPWRLNGVGFDFPQNTEIPARGFVLLVGSDPGVFRARYSVPPGVQIFGPYAGALQDNGELLELQRPDLPDIDTNGVVFIPYITVDAVRYNDRPPWPTNAAGFGPSLERLRADAFGNDPANWRASPGDASPGLANTGNRLPRVNAGADQQLESDRFPLDVPLLATAEDDGLPNPPGKLTITWTQVSGPGIVAFADASVVTATASLLGVGAYELRLTASDGVLQASDTVRFVVDRPPLLATFVPAGSQWKYLDNGSDQGTAWSEPGFSDTAWKTGKAQLGYGDGDEAKVVEDNATAGYNRADTDRYITTYFRKTFPLTGVKGVTSLTVRLVRDDGGVVYLNGTEVFRSNMPEDFIDFLTPASEVVGGGDESNFFSREVDPGLLREGNNVLAVEIHQQTPGSSDISFDLELSGTVFPINQAPTVSAGLDQTVPLGTPANLDGVVSDDGLPNPPGLVAPRWTKLSGPGTVSFANPNAVDTPANFSLMGTYVLRLSVTDGEFSVSDDLTITVTAAPPEKPRFEGAELVSGPAEGIKLRFSAQANQSYTVQYRDSLNGGAWQSLKHIDAQPTTHVEEVTDALSSPRPSRYYRLVTPKQP